MLSRFIELISRISCAVFDGIGTASEHSWGLILKRAAATFVTRIGHGAGSLANIGRRLVLRPGAGVFLLLLLIGGNTTRADHPTTKPIRVGAIYGFTGFANIWSLQAKRAIELARDEINSSGGINGRRLEVLFEDSGTTALGAVSAYNKLVKRDRVDAVVGDIISFVTLPLVPLAQRDKVVLVTPSIFETDLPNNSDYFFTTCPRKDSMSLPVERFFELNSGVKKIAIICADNTWGRTYLDVWRAAAKNHKV